MTSALRFRPNAPAVLLGGSAAMAAENSTSNSSDPIGHLVSNLTTTPGSITFPPEPEVIKEPVCQWILYEDIAESR